MLRPSAGKTLRAWLLSALVVHGAVAGNPDAKRLYDDLLSNYNKLVRPVVNTSDVLRVCIKLKLSQLIDVLSSKTGVSNEFSESSDRKTKKLLKNEPDIIAAWNDDPRIKTKPDKSRMKRDCLFPYASYDNTYEGIHSSLNKNFLPKDLNEKYRKISVLEELDRKSELIPNSLEVESTKRKNNPYILKSKRKSHKINRSKGLLEKFRDVDSMKEFKKILENFRIIGEEVLNKNCLECKRSKHTVPAYLVLKLAENPGKNSLRGKESHPASTQSFKLVFANDGVKSGPEETSKDSFFASKSLSVVKMKDELNQTSDINDEPAKGNNREVLRAKVKSKETSSRPKHCLDCIKREEDFKFQREFNAALLEQIKTMLAQSAVMIGLLNDLMNFKNGNGNTKEDLLIKEHFFKNFSKTEESSGVITTERNVETSTDLTSACQLHKNIESVSIEDCGNGDFGDEKIFKMNYENFGKDDMSSIFVPKIYEEAYYVSQSELNRIGKKQHCRKFESSLFDMKSKYYCQIKHRYKKRKQDILNSTKRNKTVKLKKAVLEKNDSIHKRLESGGGDGKFAKKDLIEEEDDADYDDTGDEAENDCDKTETDAEGDMFKKNKQHVIRTNRLGENHVRVSLEDAGLLQSRGNDAKPPACDDRSIKPSYVPSRLNLKNQIMTTNLWVEQSWYDYKLRWDPKEYGGVHMLHVPSDHIWRPDIVLYNNADGNYEVTLMTKARVSHTGLVEWQPPAVYKSSCAIDVEFFPYDIQTCVLKLGSWTYDGFKVDLRHMDEKAGSNVVEVGVDLSEFYMSVEWDILEVPAVRNEKFYTCCDEPYLDITFNITMRRKTLFYTVNIIIPCMGISFLTVLTFYLPSDSGEKVTLSISILISLHVFFLLVVEIIPPTSLVVPLLGKYLIFAMILVSISICVTVVVLNVHFRSPQTHKMAPWVKRVFIHILPRLLVMRRPQYHYEPHRFMSRRIIMQTVKGKEIQTSYYPYPYQTSAAENPKTRDIDSLITRQRTFSKEDFSPESLADGEPVFGGSCQIHGPPPQSESEELSLSGADGGANGEEDIKSPTIKNPAFSHTMCPPEVHKSCFCVRFIAEHTKMLEDSTKVKEDWKYVAMVLDRLFLWIFTLAVLVGTAGIILQAPTLYDDRIPIDKQFAEIQTSTVIRCPPQ